MITNGISAISAVRDIVAIDLPLDACVGITDKGILFTQHYFQGHIILTVFVGDGIMYVYDLGQDFLSPDDKKKLHNKKSELYNTRWNSDPSQGYVELLCNLVNK